MIMSEDPETLGRIIKGIKKKYDKDKENWKVYGGTDNTGNSDLLISQDPDLWYIKSKYVDPFRAISYGKQLKSIDDDISREINKNKKDSKDVFHSLFGMSVPVSEKDIITAAGLMRVAPREMSLLKKRISDKYPNVGKNLQRKVQKTWKNQFPDRDNIYL